jgi:auxin influx carrier (AUX1 LAX family)
VIGFLTNKWVVVVVVAWDSFCREIMHAMWKPVKFKYVYVFATLYVFTLTIPSAIAVYWAFGDLLLTNANALALLPRSGARDLAVVLMLIHQVT